MRKIELLAPAGSFDSLVAAVESGADAVYVGGSKFNARAFADNFDADTLKKAVEYAHIRGVRVYVTVNILVAESEIKEIIDYIGFLYSIDVDAVIVQDIALIKIINENYPDFEIHCSTQMTVHNSDGAIAYANMKVKRIVLARELTLKEITQIVKKSGIEIEVFIHGALCVSYSGQCLMSSMIGGRSGNRGRCAQPCRKKYSFFDINKNMPLNELSKKHLISTRDLNTLKRLEEVIASGVTSLKIEGRMKRPEYVAVVIKNYRQAIDKILEGNKNYADNNAQYELKSVFNREFTEGYIFNKKNNEIVSINRPDNRGISIGRVISKRGNIISVLVEENFISDGDAIEIIDKNGNTTGTTISGIKTKGTAVKSVAAGQIADIFIREKIEINSAVNKIIDRELYEKALTEYSYTNRKKIPVDCKLRIEVDNYPNIEIADYEGNVVSCTVKERVQLAQKVATTKEKLISQLNKTGDVPFYFKSIDVEIEDNCNVPARVINELRREAVHELSIKRANLNNRSNLSQINTSILDKYADDCYIKHHSLEVVASVRSLECAKGAIHAGADVVYIMYNWGFSNSTLRDIIELCKANERKCYILLPTITKDSELELIEKELREAIIGWDNLGFVISNIGQLNFAFKYTPNNIRLNYSFNIFNSISMSALNNYYADLSQCNINCICLSPELNTAQIKTLAQKTNIRLEGLIYGHIPVMTTDYCSLSLLGNCKGCNKHNKTYGLIDEKGKVFPILQEGFCRSKILNSDVLFLIEDINNVISAGISSLRADFYYENEMEAYNIVKLIKSKNTNKTKEQQNIIHEIKGRGFTKGHYFRGVD